MITQGVSKWFRGVAILMVIASHYAGWMFVEPVNPQLREWVMTLGVYGVDIFFLLSGYGLVKSVSKSGINGRFIWNRFAGSYLPYFVVAGILELTDAGFEDWEDVWKFLSGYDYWFMANLFVFYLFFMIFWNAGAARGMFLTIAVALYSNYLASIGRSDFWYVSNFAFVIGVLWAGYEKYENPFFSKVYGQIVLLIGSFVGMKFSYEKYVETMEISWENWTGIFFTLVVLAGCLIISTAGKRVYESQKWLRILFSGRIMGTLGVYSLFIYLIHTRLFYLVVFEFEDLGYRNQAAITGLITLAAAVVIGIIFSKLVELFEKKVLYRKKA